MSFTKMKALAIAAALVAAAGCGGGGGSKNQQPPDTSGNAKVAVSAASTQSQINHITLTINQGTVSSANPAMADIVLELNQAPSKNEWTAAITAIPAGGGRVFKAAAYSAPGTAAANLIYYGETLVSVAAGNTASVTILLQETNVPAGPTRFTPQITALSASNSYVLPSTPVVINVTAVDPDHQGDDLSFHFFSSCDAGGAGSFTPGQDPTATKLTTAPYTPTAPGYSVQVTYVPPAVDATCSIGVTAKESAVPTNKNTPLSVTTYFTVVVNTNFGRAIVAGFPNSYPIVSIRGDFRYNFFSDVNFMPVGQAADFQFSAVDNDGDNVEYKLTAKCGSSFADAANQPNLSEDYFYYLNGTTQVGPLHAPPNTDGTLYRTTGTTGVSPPAAYTSAWYPHFGVSPGFIYTNPNQYCAFTLTVHDLCTAGNCNPGTVGGAADGSYKTTLVNGVSVTSFTTGVINANPPSVPVRAPVIDSIVTVNQDGPAATGVQTWDPTKKSFVNGSTPYELQVTADNRWQNGAPLTVLWSCNTGSASIPVNTPGTGFPGQVTSAIVFTTGSAVPPNAACTATFTDTASGLSSVATLQFIQKDQCAINNWNAGQACSSGNLCLTGETCNSSYQCVGGTAVVCPITDTQCQVATCDPAQGCGVTNFNNNPALNDHLCNKDSNGCTQNDFCQSGVCTVGSTVVCNTPTDTQCQSASGTCNNTGNNTHTCSYVNFSDTTLCNKDSNGCTQGDHCASGVCSVGTPVTCVNTTNPCQASSGTCQNTGNNNFACNFANVGNGTPCSTGGGASCTSGQTCQGGQCQGGSSACPPGQTCTAGTPPICSPTTVSPTLAKDIVIVPPEGLAMDANANVIITAPIYSTTPIDFGGGFQIASTGDADILVAKYNKSGAIQWAVGVGDDNPPGGGNPQIPIGVAATSLGRVAVIGQYSGQMTFGPDTISSGGLVDFLVWFDSAGNRLHAKSFALGSNGQLLSVAANPSSATDRVAVCGKASQAATSLVPGAVYGGNTDAVIGVFDATGTRLWSAQLGNTGFETCTAAWVDDNGDVWATGQFDGANLSFPATPNPIVVAGPNNANQKWVWVAKFAGAGGTGNTAQTLAATAYTVTSGVAQPLAITTDLNGDLILGGTYTANLTVGTGTGALTLNSSAGAEDAFFAKVSGANLNSASWLIRFGGSLGETVGSMSTTSFGDVLVTGTFSASSAAFRTANGGHDTTGAAALNNAGAAGSGSTDSYLMKLNRSTGATEFSAAYGNPGAQTGDFVWVNRYGSTPNDIAFSGSFAGPMNFGGTSSPITSVGVSDAYLVFAHLQ